MKQLPQGDDAALEHLQTSGNEERDLSKPWMKYHSFELVRSAARVRELVDEAIRVGRVALDTETQGLDTRIEFREDGSIYTRHAIVGYCLGIEGKGYYIPVRHVAELNTDANPNVDSVARTEAEVTRLCQAAQPVLKEGFHDILGAKEKDFERPPQVIIEFWHAKFDQEMLYPITGIDIWSPYSFDDGMLMVYVLCTEDEQGLKENAYERLPPVKDPETGAEHRYEMIEFAELFPKGMKRRDRKIQTLVPREEDQGRNVLLYGCSDGICTDLLCGLLKPKVLARPNFSSFYTLEKQVVQAVRVIERTRVLINKGEIASLLQEAEDELKACEERIQKLAVAAGFPADFNPSSSAQLAEFLFGPQGIWQGDKPDKTSEGQYKTDEKTIEEIAKDPRAHGLEAFSLIIKHRQINKVRGTYLQNLAQNTDELDQLRLNFRQTGAATGRFTAPKGDREHGYAGVPIQGIPARDDPKKPKVAHSLRRMFIARPGYVIAKIDYASQELRIAASTSGEQKWIAEYEKEAATGEPADLHFLTAQAFYPGLTKDSPDYKIKRNGGKCVHPDTLVSSGIGYAPLREFAQFAATPDTFAAVEGVQVDGLPVVQTYNGGVKPLLHVVTRKGIVTCTAEHRFMAEHGELVRAGDLQPDHILERVQLDPLVASQGAGSGTFKLWRGVPGATYRLDSDLCYFAGVFLGDGSVSASSAKITHGHVEKLDAFGCTYLEWQTQVLETCRRAGIDAERGPDTVYLGSRVTVRYLVALGLVCPRPGSVTGRMKNLRVPSWVLRNGPTGFLSFLGGLIDTDGSVGHQRRAIEFTTKDFVFAGQLMTIAQACGLALSAEATYNRTYERYYARLKFSVESSWALREYLRYPGKIERLGPPTYAPVTRDLNSVLAVIPAGEGPCLDITMGTESHLYRANGFLTHNTANFALIYGGGVGAVQRATGCDKVEGARLKKAFDESVPMFSKWVKGQHASVKRNLGVSTGFGRFIAIPDANVGREGVIRRFQTQGKKYSEQEIKKEVHKVRAACERKATNFPIQGCLAATSMVQTRQGAQSIGSLQEAASFEVWTGTRWSLAVVRDMGRCERAEIELTDGTTIECDTRHKLLVVSQDKYEWVAYDELLPGMAVATALCEPLELASPPPLPRLERRRGQATIGLAPALENELWYWLGRYIGDGWLDARGAIDFVFGDHERSAIERCKAFWVELGLNPKESQSTHCPRTKESTRFKVTVWSVDLYDWLLELGLSAGVTAHTKRCPERIFVETLEKRRAFLRGVMDSDGHKPSLPEKIDGIWDRRRRGNPYAVHLCQRPLLVDLKRLLRTVGVESIVRGPYTSGKDTRGAPTTSFRLDLNRRMFERHVMGARVRLPKMHDMFAPQFLVDELLRVGPFTRSSFRDDESAYVLYLRLREGGRVTIYTLRALCKLLDVELSQPFYGFKRLKEKRALGRVETTYTLSVQDPLHRFESDGVITKNSGADILKISLVLLLRELHLRGWLKNGGDDSVRIIMTVHDEIVFEIREERVAEAIPIITKIMEHPGKLVKWRVPLVAEADLGPSWAAKISWSALFRAPKEGDAAPQRPSYLEGVEVNLHPEVLVLGAKVEVSTPKPLAPVAALPPREVAPAAESPAPAAVALSTDQPPREAARVNGPHLPPAAQGTAPAPGMGIASIKLNTRYVSRKTVCMIAQACVAAKIESIKEGLLGEELPVEFLLGGDDDVLLYSAKENYKVPVEELAANLRRINLLQSYRVRDVDP